MISVLVCMKFRRTKAEFEEKACHILSKGGYLGCSREDWNIFGGVVLGLWSVDQLVRCQTTNPVK